MFETRDGQILGLLSLGCTLTMQPVMDDGYNLTALARKLSHVHKHRGMVDAVALSQSAHAAVQDLLQAQRLLDRFTALTPKWDPTVTPPVQDQDDAEIAGAIFKLAVIIYARGTSDGSNTRRKMHFRNALNGEDLERHKRLIALRDKAIAHADVTDHFIDGPWLVGNMALVFNGDTTESLRYDWKGANYRQNMVVDLVGAIPVAMAQMNKFSSEFDDALHAELVISFKDPNVVKILQDHPMQVHKANHREENLHLPATRSVT